MTLDIRWTTAFLDRPAVSFGAAVDFWTAVTRSTLSAPRGERQQFATLLPPDGEPYLRVQQVVDGPGGSHLDLHVPDVATATDTAVALGAEVTFTEPGLTVLTDPGGLLFCLVRDSGERIRPEPVTWAGGQSSLVDQLCLDSAAERFEDTVGFWSALTGWEIRASSISAEFCSLLRPPGIPLRLLLQRTGESGITTRSHLDLACDDVAAEVARHQDLGAAVVRVREGWTTLRDPAGLEYCVTRRNPRTGTV